MMDRLQQISNELKDKNEINIMEEYGNKVKNFTAIITCKIIHVNLHYKTKLINYNSIKRLSIKQLNRHDYLTHYYF